MKKIFLFTAAVLMSIGMLSAQKPGSRLPLKVYVEQLPQPFPANAQVTMVGKIHQMLTAKWSLLSLLVVVRILPLLPPALIPTLLPAALLLPAMKVTPPKSSL